MKHIAALATAFCLTLSLTAHAQTPATVEKNLPAINKGANDAAKALKPIINETGKVLNGAIQCVGKFCQDHGITLPKTNGSKGTNNKEGSNLLQEMDDTQSVRTNPASNSSAAQMQAVTPARASLHTTSNGTICSNAPGADCTVAALNVKWEDNPQTKATNILSSLMEKSKTPKLPAIKVSVSSQLPTKGTGLYKDQKGNVLAFFDSSKRTFAMSPLGEKAILTQQAECKGSVVCLQGLKKRMDDVAGCFNRNPGLIEPSAASSVEGGLHK
ncbi:MAG: hypothetical protein JST16_03135 [Bdellovibrionales bacterium]|nr:hypothetical protein [Bdellovibrionales bacterium]